MKTRHLLATVLPLMLAGSEIGFGATNTLSRANYTPRHLRNGHSAWDTVKDAKTKKSRAKERRAKQARKHNR